jgi:hypothetical protein
MNTAFFRDHKTVSIMIWHEPERFDGDVLAVDDDGITLDVKARRCTPGGARIRRKLGKHFIPWRSISVVKELKIKETVI